MKKISHHCDGRFLFSRFCAKIRAKLDAYYARLYGLTRDELRYTPCGVDPKEVHGEDFPGGRSAC